METDPLNSIGQGPYGVHLSPTRRHGDAIGVPEEMFRTNPAPASGSRCGGSASRS